MQIRQFWIDGTVHQMCQNVPKICQMCQNVPKFAECAIICQNVPNVPKCAKGAKMCQNVPKVPKCAQKCQNVPICAKICQMGQMCQNAFVRIGKLCRILCRLFCILWSLWQKFIVLLFQTYNELFVWKKFARKYKLVVYTIKHRF